MSTPLGSLMHSLRLSASFCSVCILWSDQDGVWPHNYLEMFWSAQTNQKPCCTPTMATILLSTNRAAPKLALIEGHVGHVTDTIKGQLTLEFAHSSGNCSTLYQIMIWSRCLLIKCICVCFIYIWTLSGYLLCLSFLPTWGVIFVQACPNLWGPPYEFKSI